MKRHNKKSAIANSAPGRLFRFLETRGHAPLFQVCAWLFIGTAFGLQAQETPLPAKPANNEADLPDVGETNFPSAGALATNAPALAGETGGPAPGSRNVSRSVDLPSFRLIWERNIFNPNRSPRYAWNRSSRRESARPERTESFALAGTMSYEKGRFAFFDGSSSEYRKVLEPAGNIAGFTIADISTTHVRLESTNGPAIDLPVGMQMKKMREGGWTLTERATSSDGSGSSSSAPESSEALRRLLQKREQEDSGESTNAPETTDNVEQKADKTEKAEPSPTAGAADEILKRLMQKREQELNK